MMTDTIPAYETTPRIKRRGRARALNQDEDVVGDAAPNALLNDSPSPPREAAIYDRVALLDQLERVYGRPYMFDDELELGLP